MVADLFDTVLPPLSKGYPEYRSDQPRGGDGRWSGGGGVSEGRAKGSKGKSKAASRREALDSLDRARSKALDRTSDATLKRRAAKRKREIEAAQKQAHDALDKVKEALKKPEVRDSMERINEALKNARDRQQQVNDSLRKESDATMRELNKASLWMGVAVLAIEAALLSYAIEFAGKIHPAAGVAAGVFGLGYLAKQTFDLIRGRYDAGAGAKSRPDIVPIDTQAKRGML